jgi:hypothetical protein
MSTDFVEITKTTQEQFFGALTAVQETVLETYGKLASATEKYVPAELRSPKDLPVDPKAVLDLGFGFASQLVETQKAFAEKLLAIVPSASGPAPAPAAPVTPAAKVK